MAKVCRRGSTEGETLQICQEQKVLPSDPGERRPYPWGARSQTLLVAGGQICVISRQGSEGRSEKENKGGLSDDPRLKINLSGRP